MQNNNNTNVECLGGKVSSKPHPIKTAMIVMPAKKLHSEQKLPNKQYSLEHSTKTCHNHKLVGILIPKPMKVTVYNYNSGSMYDPNVWLPYSMLASKGLVLHVGMKY